MESAMADDKSKRAPQDASKINVNEPYELEYWTKHLGVSAEELKKAVKEAGTGAAAVRKHLGK
jgi:hypothetical protein